MIVQRENELAERMAALIDEHAMACIFDAIEPMNKAIETLKADLMQRYLDARALSENALEQSEKMANEIKSSGDVLTAAIADAFEKAASSIASVSEMVIDIKEFEQALNETSP